LSFNGVKNSTDLTFIADIKGSPTGTEWSYLNMYSTATSGTLECSNLKDNILYSDYGAYFFGSGNSLLPPANPAKTVSLGAGDIVYTSILKTGMTKCENGLTIHAGRDDGKTGSALLDYRITFSDGSEKTGQLSFVFPGDNLVEPVYYPASGPAVTVTLFGDAQYDVSGPVSLASPCGATASFTVTPKSNLTTYKLITQYTCPDSPVGLGLSITGEFRKTGTSDPWTSFEFVEGICELQLEAGADYNFRVNIDSEYYEYTLPTDVDRIRPFLEEHQNDDYRLISLEIVPGDELVTITASVELSQGVCDKLN
jgi:hypothetical protein